MNALGKHIMTKNDLLFLWEVENARLRLRLAQEVYNARAGLGLTQAELAKASRTTQRVISNIENGEVNIGIELLNRLAESLNFSARNWANLFNFDLNNFFNVSAVGAPIPASPWMPRGIGMGNSEIRYTMIKDNENELAYKV